MCVAVSGCCGMISTRGHYAAKDTHSESHLTVLQINWAMNDKQEFIDIVEVVYRGARKGRGLVVSPKGQTSFPLCISLMVTCSYPAHL